MSRFRITTWPDGPIRLAPIQMATMIAPVEDARLDYSASGIPAIVGSLSSSLANRKELPDETYLRRLRELDLDDPDDLVDFAGAFGFMGLTVAEYSTDPIPYLRGLADFGPLAHILFEEGLMGISVNELRAVATTETDFSSERAEHWIERRQSFETVDTFKLAARWIRDLTTVALDLDDLDGGPPKWESHWVERPETRAHATLLLRSGLGALLRPFSPRIEIGDEDELEDEVDETLLPEKVIDLIREHVRQPTLEVPLMSALAMQLYNHLAEQADFRTCGNEKCRRSFVTQQGRAEHGQHHRNGRVKYCSVQCGRAQATRDYRRRKAATEDGST